MPRIIDEYLHTAVYVYGNVEDADAGKAVGGSGFLVNVTSGTSSSHHQIYVVTNRHVAYNPPTPILRMNKLDGTVGGFSTEQQDWTVHPDGDDVAVLPVRLPANIFKYATLDFAMFVSDRLIVDEDIGVGDDTFMVGRFMGHDGKRYNTPSMRFGNIAMMPGDKITSSSGFSQESFLVEMRSLPGYSGSAVYVYSPNSMNDMSKFRGGQNMSNLPEFNLFGKEAQTSIDLMMNKLAPKGPYLLGIDWCHLNNICPVLNRANQPSEGLYVSLNSGMAGVVPAWKIAETINAASGTNIQNRSRATAHD